MRSELRLVASWLALSILLSGCDLGGEQAPDPTRAVGGVSTMLDFTIELADDTFKVGDSIPVTLTLTNAGQQSAVVNIRMAPNAQHAPDETRDVTFTVRSPSGDELPLGVFINVRGPRDDNFAELAPGESVSTTIDLATLFSFSEPGKYTVQAVYTNVNDPSSGVAWKGQLASEVLTLSVSE